MSKWKKLQGYTASRSILLKNRTISCINVRDNTDDSNGWTKEGKDKICINCTHELEYNGYYWKHRGDSFTCLENHCICINAHSNSIRYPNRLRETQYQDKY